MKSVDINAVLNDLDLSTVEIDCNEKLVSVYSLFEKNVNLPGIIVRKDGKFYRMLSKTKFFQVMSKQYMFDLFCRRSVQYFFDDNHEETFLMLNGNVQVIEAAEKALLREDWQRFEPIIVVNEKNETRLLSIHTLLLAQNEVQQRTMLLYREANEFKKDVLKVVSHDLRNPLAGIIGFIRLLKSESYDQTDKEMFIDHIHTSANNMNDMINSFLQSVLNDSTDFELSCSEVDLVSLVSYVITNLDNLATEKNQTLRFENSIEKALIYADRNRIIEVIENLISNAIKYSEKGKKILIEVISNNGTVLFKVIDEGPGLSKEDINLAFGKFQKLTPKPTGDESSTGLGLYIVKRIITKHNGRVGVESEPGKGSTFYFILPDANLK